MKFLFLAFFLLLQLFFKNHIYSIYCDELLLNFESKFTNFITSEHPIQSAQINPAPILSSKRYLSWKLPAYLKKSASLVFDPPLLINSCKCCKKKSTSSNVYANKITLWVYSNNINGKLFFLLKDALNQTHVLLLGSTTFKGWRKLSMEIPKNIFQKSFTINNKKPLEVKKIIFSAKKHSKTPFLYLFLDDLSIHLRNEFFILSEENLSFN